MPVEESKGPAAAASHTQSAANSAQKKKIAPVASVEPIQAVDEDLKVSFKLSLKINDIDITDKDSKIETSVRELRELILSKTSNL